MIVLCDLQIFKHMADFIPMLYLLNIYVIYTYNTTCGLMQLPELQMRPINLNTKLNP